MDSAKLMIFCNANESSDRLYCGPVCVCLSTQVQHTPGWLKTKFECSPYGKCSRMHHNKWISEYIHCSGVVLTSRKWTQDALSGKKCHGSAIQATTVTQWWLWSSLSYGLSKHFHPCTFTFQRCGIDNRAMPNKWMNYRSSSSVFMTNNTPSGAKMHRESTEPESHQTAKMFFFLLLLQTG